MAIESGRREFTRCSQGHEMKLKFVNPRHELQPYIESFWVFESPTGFPATDSSIVTPNGCSKLIIPCENSLCFGRKRGSPNQPRAEALFRWKQRQLHTHSIQLPQD